MVETGPTGSRVALGETEAVGETPVIGCAPLRAGNGAVSALRVFKPECRVPVGAAV